MSMVEDFQKALTEAATVNTAAVPLPDVSSSVPLLQVPAVPVPQPLVPEVATTNLAPEVQGKNFDMKNKKTMGLVIGLSVVGLVIILTVVIVIVVVRGNAKKKKQAEMAAAAAAAASVGAASSSETVKQNNYLEELKREALRQKKTNVEYKKEKNTQLDKNVKDQVEHTKPDNPQKSQTVASIASRPSAGSSSTEKFTELSPKQLLEASTKTSDNIETA